ncbi:DedA family protein [Bacillus sp. PS06]|uniref:DedA family protein n=1 Tax=Bacillus sp. PS06 TaxID=2764176 RepID=UPI00177A7BB8|nr:VTT domain-containing protein [Bacillus sp. PS06]MBD8070531.1 VTT domain-containing protein [Bacillus sp. PS06]
MIEQFLQWLNTLGFPGLFLVMFLEGSSLPFPGIVIVLSFGYLFSPGYLGTAVIAIGMSISYTIASLIPYFFGRKLEKLFPNRLQKGLVKGKLYFKKYGIWSIALSRPFGIGNYISYVAGMSKVNLLNYLLLTFLGIYPWSFTMILLGDYFNGNYNAVMDFLHSYSIYIYGAILILLICIVLFYYRKTRKQKGQNEVRARKEAHH